MNAEQSSLFADFVGQRRRIEPVFGDVASETTVFIVADRNVGNSAAPMERRIYAALADWRSVNNVPLRFGETRHVVVAEDSDVINTLVIGVGDSQQLGELDYEKLGGSCYAALEKLGINSASWTLDPNLCSGPTAAHFLYGIIRRSYDTDALDSSSSKPRAGKQLIVCMESDAAAEHYRTLAVHITAANIARDMVNAPPNYSTPPILVNWLKKMTADGMSTRILKIDNETKNTFPGTAAVGRSSIESPSVFLWEWRGPDGDLEIETALLGKGITFDAGGLSLKSHDHQFHMKTDLGGAAAVAGAMHSIAANKLPIGVVGLAAFAENLPGADAVRPGDVLTLANGATVEISFPDAEGRLVLSDLLVYAEREYSPKYMIDVATLTGTVIAALGTETIGCFCPDETLRDLLAHAADTSGEPIWQLPVGPRYLKSLESGVASLKNMPPHGRMGILEGSASVAASFLQTFVENSQWAHLDIAGTVWRQAANADGPAGATGSGVRLLYETVRHAHALNSK